ncbi:MAG: DNA/RNA nuclease SfsA [Thermoprotei archaeon]|nr:MAG: DNA/RNA nuclease SfsA [Thermoprotei archaeon]
MEKLMGMSEVLECTIIKRVNRFVVEIEIDKTVYYAYINNTGRLEELLTRGRRGFCIRSRAARKTSHRLFAIKYHELGAIVDTRIQMRCFEKAISIGAIPWLKGYRILKRNVRLNSSMIDYLLTSKKGEVYLEMKSAVMRKGEYAMYPDCPSPRGRRHVRDLMKFVSSGGRGIILFVAGIPGVTAFKPNRDADVQLYSLLRKAVDVGVCLKAIAIHYDPKTSYVYLYDPDLRVLI